MHRQRHERQHLPLGHHAPGTIRRPPAKGLKRWVFGQVLIIQKPLSVEIQRLRAEHGLVDMQLARGDHNHRAATKHFTPKLSGTLHAAGGGGGACKAEGLLEDGLEARTALETGGDARRELGDGRVYLSAQSGEEGGVIEDVGEHPEAKFVGVAVNAGWRRRAFSKVDGDLRIVNSDLHPEHRYHDCGDIFFNNVELAHFGLEVLNEPGHAGAAFLREFEIGGHGCPYFVL